MSPEERQLITGLFDRVKSSAGNPRDHEAEALIADAVRAQPYAPYLLAQSVIVQEQALRAANDKLQELEAKVQELEQARAGQAGAAPSGGFLGGLGSLFGGSPAAPRPPAPQPGPWQQPPQQGGFNQQPPSQGPWGGQPGGGMFGGGASAGGGFLKGALGAAAGVAGGVLLADSIRGLFGAHNNPMGIGTGFAPGIGGGDTVINNYYGGDGGDTGGPAGFTDSSYDTGGSFQDASYDDGGDYSTDDGTYDT